MTSLRLLGGAAPRFFLSKLGRPVPLILGLEVTRQCNASCVYCDICNTNVPDMPTGVLLRLLKEAWDSGTRIVSLSGGEPLMHADIAEIAEYARELGFIIRLNTNGSHPIPEALLDAVPLYDISLDGPSEVQNQTRPGAEFERVRPTLEQLTNDPRSSFTLTAVLTRPAIKYLDTLFELAEEYDTAINLNRPRLSMGAGKAVEWIPNEDEFETALHLILNHPLRHRVLNSSRALRHLFQKSASQLPICPMGRISVRVDHDGRFNDCLERKHPAYPRYPEVSFAQGFAQIAKQRVSNCPRCTVAECVNTSLLMGFDVETMFRTLKSLR